MKTLLALFLFTAAAASGQTQAEMNQQAAADFHKADAQLNAIYGKVKAALDPESQAKLKTAQRAWITFRDAEADLQADATARGGTMAPCIYDGVRQQLTETRIEELKALLEQLEQ
jgi:uncharacterized protein YecT (DUF1311 family)